MPKKLRRLKKHKHMLYILRDAKPKLRKAILKNVDEDFIKTLHEIAHNTLNKNNPINAKQKEVLQRYKTSIRKLACPKRSLTQKRKLMVQSGGFLPVLIGTILSGIIGNIIERWRS